MSIRKIVITALTLLSITAQAQVFHVQSLAVSGTVSVPANSVAVAAMAKTAANTVLANATNSLAGVTALSMPGCATGQQALQWNPGTGFVCLSSIANTGSPLNQFASTTSAQLAGIISDETGTGSLVFGTSPTITGATLSSPTVAGATITSSTVNSTPVGGTTPSTGNFTNLNRRRVLTSEQKLFCLTTTVYLIADANFTGTAQVQGYLRARRVR